MAADLAVEITGARAGVELGATGWRASIRHAVVLKDAAGADVDRWEFTEDGAVLSHYEDGIPLAFARAAEGAARRFERAFRDSPAVGRWTSPRGVEPVSPLARWPERGAQVPFLDAGPGFLNGGDGGGGALTSVASWG